MSETLDEAQRRQAFLRVMRLAFAGTGSALAACRSKRSSRDDE
jgi:hypothetical protein